MKHTLITLVTFCILLSSCSYKAEKTIPIEGEELSLDYAKNFSIRKFEKYTMLTIYDPWHDSTILGTYYLINSDTIPTPNNGTRIKTPLTSVATNTCSHIAFISNIEETNTIKGVCNPEQVYNKEIRKNCELGLCTNLGDGFSIDFEKILSVNPQLLLITEYGQTNSSIERLKQSGINIMGIVEWTEEDILGRAEWIKVFGLLYNKEREADSIFNIAKSQYNKLCELTKNVEYRPSILPGFPFRGTWYIPGGNSYMAKLFVDAGASYKYSDNQEHNSMSFDLESVLANFKNCEYWIGAEANYLREIEDSDERLIYFKPYKKGEVYNTRKRTTEYGGNDFWENAVVRPDLLLQDIIAIIHPDVSQTKNTIFLKKLE